MSSLNGTGNFTRDELLVIMSEMAKLPYHEVYQIISVIAQRLPPETDVTEIYTGDKE